MCICKLPHSSASIIYSDCAQSVHRALLTETCSLSLSLGYQPIIPGYERYIMSVNETSRTYNLLIANAQLEDEAEFECQTSGSSSTSGAKHPVRSSAFLHLIGK